MDLKYIFKNRIPFRLKGGNGTQWINYPVSDNSYICFNHHGNLNLLIVDECIIKESFTSVEYFNKYYTIQLPYWALFDKTYLRLKHQNSFNKKINDLLNE